MERVQVLIRFGYDGGRFHGVQPQPGLPTAGGALHDRLVAAFSQRPRSLQFTSRTDGGVHALANLATVWFVGPLDAAAALAHLSADHDDGLVGVAGAVVNKHVNARGISRGKHYRYLVRTGLPVEVIAGMEARVSWQARRAERRGEVPPRVDPDATAWHIHPTLDLPAMRHAATHLVGTRDFASLRSPRCTAVETTRDLHSITITADGDAVIFDIRGGGFLRQMIRILIGTLIEIGFGLRDADSLPTLLAGRDRRPAGFTAPSRGLTLMEVLTDGEADLVG
jgi:tRNA pseudouridine38-40 synthase